MRALIPALDGPLDDEALLRLYETPAARHVRANFVVALDGAIEVAGRSGALGGAADRQVFHLLRALSDVILVGAGTVRTENYGPVRLTPALTDYRRSLGLPPVPTLAVVTASGHLDPNGRLFEEVAGAGQRVVVLTGDAVPPPQRAALARRAEVIICGGKTLEVGAVLDGLALRGMGRVLTEGGPQLINHLSRAGRIDELCLTLAPLLVGPGSGTLSQGRPLPWPVTLELGHLLEADGFLLARYVVTREEPAPPTPNGPDAD